MTDNNHPITPPPELVEQWDREAVTAPMAEQSYIATQAARWGADQELEECCEWIEVWCTDPHQPAARLRASRRSKPLSLKEQALESVAAIESMSDQYVQFKQDIDIIRQALEEKQ